MKKVLYSSIFLFTILASCGKKEDLGCRSKSCTSESKSIVMRTVDQNGNPTSVIMMNAVNMRTKKTYTNLKKNVDPVNGNISYTIATDDDIKDFSEEGDNVTLLARVASGELSYSIKIAGGECACHVTKLSSVEFIVL
jgi:hypothetical protein